jgi:AraC-like DNA-binding protein
MIVEVRDETRRLRLPEPGFVLGVRYRGFASIGEGETETALPDVTLTGMALRARHMRTSADGGVLLVRFRPGGAARFFDQPLNELFETSTALTDVVPRDDVGRLQDRVSEASNDADRVRVLEEFLFARERERKDPLVAAAVQRISERIELPRIRALAMDLGLSVDAFEKRFRRVVGCTPKQFASLVRLKRAIRSYRPGVALTQIAIDAGYYDQAHFCRELRSATGQAPGQFFRSHSAEG